MNKKKLLVALAVWALVVLLTLLIFFVVFDDYSKVRVVGLVFILIAQFIALAIFISSDFIGKKSEKVMFNAGVFSFVGIYLAATIVISVVFMGVNSGVKWAALLNGILLILFAICFVVILYASSVMGEKNRKVLAAANAVKSLEIAILGLRNNPNYSEYKDNLNKLYEAAKYCDCTVFNRTDEKISGMVNELEKMLEDRQEGADIPKFIDSMLTLYKTRAEEVKQLKGGGF